MNEPVPVRRQEPSQLSAAFAFHQLTLRAGDWNEPQDGDGVVPKRSKSNRWSVEGIAQEQHPVNACRDGPVGMESHGIV